MTRRWTTFFAAAVNRSRICATLATSAPNWNRDGVGMRFPLKGLGIVLACGVMVACGSAVQSFRVPDFNDRFSGTRVHVRLKTGTGAISVQGTSVAGIRATQIMPGGEQAVVAAEAARESRPETSRMQRRPSRAALLYCPRLRRLDCPTNNAAARRSVLHGPPTYLPRRPRMIPACGHRRAVEAVRAASSSHKSPG